MNKSDKKIAMVTYFFNYSQLLINDHRQEKIFWGNLFKTFLMKLICHYRNNK